MPLSSVSSSGPLVQLVQLAPAHGATSSAALKLSLAPSSRLGGFEDGGGRGEERVDDEGLTGVAAAEGVARVGRWACTAARTRCPDRAGKLFCAVLANKRVDVNNVRIRLNMSEYV